MRCSGHSTEAILCHSQLLSVFFSFFLLYLWPNVIFLFMIGVFGLAVAFFLCFLFLHTLEAGHTTTLLEVTDHSEKTYGIETDEAR